MIRPLREALAAARAVLFDFDNILVDSEPFHYEAYRQVFARHGHELDRDEYWVHWTSRGEAAEGEVARYGLELDPVAIRAEKSPIFKAYCDSGEIPYFPEAEEIVRSLQGAGKRLAVASGTFHDNLCTLLRHGGLEDAFGVILGRDEVERGKPHPDLFLTAAERLGVEPAECVVIEDAEKGVAAAHAAGIPVAVVLTPYTKGIAFEGADWVLPDHPAFLEEVRAATSGP